MRRGELAGLKWSKVDLDAGVVYVHWQRAVASGEVEGGVVEKEPKGKSRRSIAIGPALVALLRGHRDRQRAEEDLAGIVYRRGGYVFCREDGNSYHPKFYTDRFRNLCVAAEVPVIVLHDARHSSATVGADHGVPQHAMQRRLGHAQSRTTQEVYTHVLPDAERRAAEIMEEANPSPRSVVVNVGGLDTGGHWFKPSIAHHGRQFKNRLRQGWPSGASPSSSAARGSLKTGPTASSAVTKVRSMSASHSAFFALGDPSARTSLM